jgi:glutathione synthase/RimK-type ligase-like ATP-grasp enzyme
MVKLSKQLTFHLITSKTFWYGAPLVILEILKRGHYISVFDEKNLPDVEVLLDCDVFMDMSTITDQSFYLALEKVLSKRVSLNKRIPLMIDPPKAILDSVDKRKTHKIFPDFIPESYNLNGKNNISLIKKFSNDKYVVIKPAIGWWAKNIERITPIQALERHTDSKDLIIQKYIPFKTGVGRIITINHGDDFEIASSYIRTTDFWRTGVDIKYKCVKQPINSNLYNFAKQVSQKCNLYLNGIDYIYANGKYILLEVNAVPAMKEPYDEFKINIPKKLINHIERNSINK